jgi:hypothetical protein
MSIAALIALCCLAAGVQALAPASAGAMTDQTTCLNMPIPGAGLVPGMGVAIGPDGQAYACKLDSGGAYYGGTGTAPKAPTPTAPICTGRSCLPLEIGGGGGSGSNPGRAPGSRPGAKPVVSKKPAKSTQAAQAHRDPSAKLREYLNDIFADLTADPERRMWALLCLAIDDLRKRVEVRRPENLDRLKSYRQARSLAFRGQGPSVEEDRSLEAQMPELYDYLNGLKELKATADKAECPFVGSPS